MNDLVSRLVFNLAAPPPYRKTTAAHQVQCAPPGLFPLFLGAPRGYLAAPAHQVCTP